jgi:hypothetical protein
MAAKGVGEETSTGLTPGSLRELIEKSDHVLRSTVKTIGGKIWAYPSPGLYPGAWNWDTPQIAEGLFHSDKETAIRLLEDFLTMQWENGMIPHIVFPQLTPGERLQKDVYFPPPSIWYITDDRIQDYAQVPAAAYENHPAYKATGGRTTGITQYPIWAISLKNMYDYEQQQHTSHPEMALQLTPERLAGLVEKLNKSHKWFHEHRDPLNLGIVAEFHPWMGCDNAPCYDRAMARVAAGTTPEELALIKAQRTDLKAIKARNGDSSERPTDLDYAAYIKIAHRLARVTEKEMRGEAVTIDDIPFAVYSPMLTGMLIRAERDLAALAQTAGRKGIAEEARKRADRMSKSMVGHLWDNRAGQFCYLDAKVMEKEPVKFIGTCFPLLDETLPRAIRTAVEKRLQADYITGFGIASASKDNPERVPGKPGYDPCRYWRGPIWDNVTRLLRPFTTDPGSLRDSALKRALDNGCREYSNPETGAGLGGHDFGWTAAAIRADAEARLHELEAQTPALQRETQASAFQPGGIKPDTIKKSRDDTGFFLG